MYKICRIKNVTGNESDGVEQTWEGVQNTLFESYKCGKSNKSIAS